MSLDAYYALCDLYYHYLHEFFIAVTHPRSDCLSIPLPPLSFMSLDAYYALCDLYYHYLHESLLQSLALGVTAFPFLCRSSPLCHWTPIMLYVICIIIISMSLYCSHSPSERLPSPSSAAPLLYVIGRLLCFM